MLAAMEIWHWGILVACIGLAMTLARFSGRSRRATYKATAELWDEKTLRLFSAVSDAASGKWLVLPNVELGRLVELAPGLRESNRRKRPLSELQVDFALYDRRYGNPQYALLREPAEDDECSSESLDRIRRILNEAEIATVIINDEEDYDGVYLRRLLRRRAA